MSNIFLATLKALKLPLKLLTGWLKEKPKKRKDKLTEKRLKHVRNYAPTHYSYKKTIGKKSKGRKKKVKNS